MGDPNQLRNFQTKRTIAGTGSQCFPIRWIWSLGASEPIENQIEGQNLLAVIHMPGYGLAGCFIATIVQNDGSWRIFARIVRLQPDAGSAQSIRKVEPVGQCLL